MRITRRADGLSVRAVAGTEVVLLGFDIDARMRPGLLGFAVRRAGAGEDRWILNRRTFAGQENGRTRWPSDEAPIQKFRWGDYTVDPRGEYRYRVAAAYGRPGAVELGPQVELTVTTEDASDLADPADGVRHGVHFNRGGAASQAYEHRFGARTPDEVGQEAFDWLSRGLLEAMEEFIGRAGAGDELHAAMYEAHYPPLLEALRAAGERGATVRLLYDVDEEEIRAKNEAALRAAGILRLARPRENLHHISHHKFMVLVRGGEPAAVWTGSTNMSEHAFYAQLNVGHSVASPAVARTYLALHGRLWEGPTLRETRDYLEQTYPHLLAMPQDGVNVVFSPRSTDEAMEYYLELMEKAQDLVVLTTPFGVDRRIEQYLAQPSPAFRMGLVGSRGRWGGTVEGIDNMNGVRYVIPARIRDNALDRWQAEQWGEETHAYIHTKFLLVDPLGDAPLVVTGSANFSHASCAENDENMLVVSGSRPVADIYLTEFMRMFDHYAFRQLLEDDRKGVRSLPLTPDDTWTGGYFRPGSEKERQRLLFGGAHAAH